MLRSEARTLLRTTHLNIRGFEEHEINFTLSPGSRIGILGAAGSGKTSLLRALARLDPLSHGKLFWGNNDVSRKFLWRMKKQQHYVSLLLANPYSLFDAKITVSQLLRDIKIDAGMTAIDLLQQNGIPGPALEQPIGSLSGVMRVRLALIIMQHNQSPVVLIDDIFKYIVRDVWNDTLHAINGIVDGSQALVIVSRFYECLVSADYILVIHDRHFIEGGPRELIFSNPAHPVTRKLMFSGKCNPLVNSNEDDAEIVDNFTMDSTISIEPGHWILANDSEIAHS